MPRRLLAPTDFSAPADRAIRYAADLAEATGGELELVHVCDAAPSQGPPAGAPAEAEQTLMTQLQALADDLAARGIPTRATVVGPTDPSTALLEAAASVDLVVISTRGASGERPGLGSVATAVARHARSPVLLVGPDARGLGAGLRILVPVDLSEASAVALREARALAATLSGSVEVVHAIPDAAEAVAWGGEPVGAADEPEASRRLRYVERFVADALGAPGTEAAPPVHVHLAEGEPVAAVARIAREERADLILAGRPSGRPTALDALMEAATQAAQCPSLRVPVS